MKRWRWAALLLALGAPGQAQVDSELPVSGDAARGRLVFGACRACHSLRADAALGNGPHLHRIFGRAAGKQVDFEHYSAGFKDAQFVWTPRLMYAWLANPMAFFPATTMLSPGVPDPQRRADLIAYLKQASVRDKEPDR